MPKTATQSYIEAIGRRKRAIARVRVTKATRESMAINERELGSYFATTELQKTVMAPLSLAALKEKFAISIRVFGGGIASQADALRLGIARALIIFEPELRKNLKKAGHLKRDPRKKERKKFGLKKARKAGQWSKR
jgi:small subunit ribosomal protein S9